MLRCMKHERSEIRRVQVGHKASAALVDEVWVPEKFINNRITTSKYTLLNFLPKNLFEQFRRVANFYFLIVGIIQLLIDTPVTPITSILPLVFVISVTAIKQGYEDWLRHKADGKVNNRTSTVVEGGRLKHCRSMDIKVGDIVRVPINNEFPCDMVLLSSSDPEGKCYITTANLDGETNLKTRTCVAETRKFQRDGDFEELQALIECEQPVADLYTFKGRLYLMHQGERLLRSLSIENVLLRGARLKNTSFVYGCAMYTGQESKMALNSKFKKTKVSRIERRMNTFLILFLLVLFVLCSTFTGLKHWYTDNFHLPWYVPEGKDSLTVRNVIEDFLAFMVLFNYVIPISLYVTVEMQKFLGSLFFGWDVEMYDETTDLPAQANTSDLNEELGEVEYLFTDKTGTLTENNMCFRMCSIDGTMYENVDGHLCLLASPGGQPVPVTAMSKLMEEFFTVLALCHTVRVDSISQADMAEGASTVSSSTGDDYDYQASSPDEKALVEACRRFGIVYHGMQDQCMEVSFSMERRRFHVLHVLDFTSTRRCMSVIVRNEQDEIYLLCKGAEMAVFGKISSQEAGSIPAAKSHIDQLATLGLRTLAIAHKKFTPDEYEQVNALLTEAKMSLHDRENRVEEAYSQVEQDLRLLGVTAVEDKLQDKVPETLIALRQAGIKVWVLTGDKEETAINISYSTGHFQFGMAKLHLTGMMGSQDCYDKLLAHRRTVTMEGDVEHVLVVDGQSLTLALATKDCRAALLRLCESCVAVLCCRMSPIQKAEVVHLIKGSKKRPVTAAIGDGANDVSMIQEADVGLGIMGKEGRQAVQSSDYAFGKFNFLSRALLLHGHYYYFRLSTLVQYFFYKNVAFVIPQIFYQFFSSFSQQTLYDPFYLMFYNITFTSLPILLVSLFEQNVHSDALMHKPPLYRRNSRNSNLSWLQFLKWSVLGLWHGTVCFFGVFFLFNEHQSVMPNGKLSGLGVWGSLVNMAVVFVVNIKLALLVHYWSVPIVAAYAFAAVGNLGLTFVVTSIIWPDWVTDTNSFYWVQVELMSSLTVWLALLLIVLLALIPDIIIRTFDDIRDRHIIYRPRCMKHERSEIRRVQVGHKASTALVDEVWVPEKFVNNRITTSKYTLLNFLPKNLFEQFRRVANFYFLISAIIQLLIDSPVSPFTSILPLVFVISVTAIKQGYEDWLRHKVDGEINNRMRMVVEGGHLKNCRSMDIKVGDIVHVPINNKFPCDMVLLSSSDPEGKCYITTANLDGETNLKTRTCITETRKFQRDGDFEELQALIECEQPVADLYTFNGRLHLMHQGERLLRSLSIENVLLRGARLKNTSFVYGCAVYTGQESKMALNSKFKKTKVSQIERRMNTFLILIFIVLFVLCSTFTGLKHSYTDNFHLPWYVPEGKDSLTVENVIEDFLAFMVLFNYVIPISLYVTVEMQKFLGAMFFGWDMEMYDEKTDLPAQANTSDLNEELGQVEYLFTDKTGTLTENNMCFRKCSIDEAMYENIDGQLYLLPSPGGQPVPVEAMSKPMEEFFTVLALCHTVRVDSISQADMAEGASPVFSSTGDDYDYQASSPDEKALVEACRRFGIVYHGMQDQCMEVSFSKERRRFHVLHVLDFTSTRRCMSVIVRNEQDEIYLLCKGAEMAVFGKISPQEAGSIPAAKSHIDQLATLGLRTLAIAHKKFTPDEYEQVNALLTEAKMSLHDRENRVEEAYSQVEQDLRLLGVTAVEDKLQDKVPETLIALRQAGIKVWVLTGDKEETAINISYSTGHFLVGMAKLHLTGMTGSQDCYDKLLEHRGTVTQEGDVEHVLVVDGQSLTLALATKACRAELLRLCENCVAVLCCRMSPIQKAEVVHLIKGSKKRPVTAAIGDGANDVSMIQEADVGLGIMGKEGRQAVRSSDYAFSKFSFLLRALLLHGHYYYFRLSTLVQYFFYKNLVLVIPQIFFQFFTSFSEQTLYEPFSLIYYNLTFTSLPVLLFSLFEQNVPSDMLMRNPRFYRRNYRNSNLSWLQFLKWSVLGLWHGTVCFFGVFFLFNEHQSVMPNGKLYGLGVWGSLVNMAVVFVVSIKLALLVHNWSVPIVAAYAVTAGGNLVMTFVVGTVIWPNWIIETNFLYGVHVELMSSYIVWLALVLIVVLALLPDILIRLFDDIRTTIPLTDLLGSVYTPKGPAYHFFHQAVRHPNDLARAFGDLTSALMTYILQCGCVCLSLSNIGFCEREYL